MLSLRQSKLKMHGLSKKTDRIENVSKNLLQKSLDASILLCPSHTLTPPDPPMLVAFPQVATKSGAISEMVITFSEDWSYFSIRRSVCTRTKWDLHFQEDKINKGRIRGDPAIKIKGSIFSKKAKLWLHNIFIHLFAVKFKHYVLALINVVIQY